MSGSRVLRKDGKTTIVINGDFTFEVNREFRNAYLSGTPGKQAGDSGFFDSNYVDSAGLGMLIRLREHVGKDANRSPWPAAMPRSRRSSRSPISARYSVSSDAHGVFLPEHATA